MNVHLSEDRPDADAEQQASVVGPVLGSVEKMQPASPEPWIRRSERSISHLSSQRRMVKTRRFVSRDTGKAAGIRSV